MCQPFYMEYETRFNNNKNCGDIYSQFANVVKVMRDTETGLYYHAYDSSRRNVLVRQGDRIVPEFLAESFRLVRYGPSGYPWINPTSQDEESLKQMEAAFRDLIDAMLKYQDESGMWVSGGKLRRPWIGIIWKPAEAPFFSYAILKGVRLGYLPKDYAGYGKKGFPRNLPYLIFTWKRGEYEPGRDLPGGRAWRQGPGETELTTITCPNLL